MRYVLGWVMILVVSIGAQARVPTVSIPQDLQALTPSSQRLVPATIQAWRLAEFNRRFFSPWTRESAQHAKTVRYLETAFQSERYYGENKLVISTASIAGIVGAMATPNYPSRWDRAITVANTSLRIVPSLRPFYKSFDRAGEGFPFDYAQESGLPANLPLLITHATQDGSWVLVETPELTGWVQSSDVALISTDNRTWMMARSVATPIQDDFGLTDLGGVYRLQARIGMRFPVVSTASEALVIATFVRDVSGWAARVDCPVSANNMAPIPLPYTPESVARLGNQLMGQCYGWGDSFGNRDCSSMIQDLLVPYGIWLPRNGNDQGVSGGYFISLKGLSREDKTQFIIQNAKPFATLLWFRGHIMMMVGVWEGKPLVFHSVWGLRTRGADGKDGRYILGGAMVTTLTPGESIAGTIPTADLIDRVEGMTMLMPMFY